MFGRELNVDNVVVQTPDEVFGSGDFLLRRATGDDPRITRHAGGTDITVSFPDNPDARRSVRTYTAALARVFGDVAAVTGAWIDEITRHANTGSTPA